jgi:hypothetical protein
VYVGTARKWQDTSTRIALNAKPCKIDLDLDLDLDLVWVLVLVRNVACVERMDGADCPNKAPKWYKDLNKKEEAAGSSVEVVLATVNEHDSKEQDFHVACQ